MCVLFLTLKKYTGYLKQQQASSRVSTDSSLKKIVFYYWSQVQLNFYSIFIMKRFTIPSNASKDVVKRMIYDPDSSQGALSEARLNINKGFEDLR